MSKSSDEVKIHESNNAGKCWATGVLDIVPYYFTLFLVMINDSFLGRGFWMRKRVTIGTEVPLCDLAA